MALYIDENGTITVIQGDSGELVVSGLDKKKNYDVYFSIQNKKRKFMVPELNVKSNFSDMVTFVLTSDYTDLLTVPINKDYEIYYYGFKICDDNLEDTLVVANSDYGSLNEMLVYPKKVEGV